MRLLADENVHSRVVAALREAGQDVESIKESAPGSSDLQILGRPDIAGLVLITYDRDFGELVFSAGVAAPHAIVYSRLGRSKADEVARRILALIAGGRLPNNFVVIEPDGERFRPLPQAEVGHG